VLSTFGRFNSFDCGDGGLLGRASEGDHTD
jgi:hypothetical protein